MWMKKNADMGFAGITAGQGTVHFAEVSQQRSQSEPHVNKNSGLNYCKGEQTPLNNAHVVKPALYRRTTF